MYGDFKEFGTLIGNELPFYGVDNNCFKLGDRVFEAVEDESDGYRSYLGSVEVRDPSGLIFFRTPLASVRVVEVDDNYAEEYQLVDDGGHVWLRFGTNNCDDYYPYFVFEYQPRKG